MKALLATVALGLGGGSDLVALAAARALLRTGIDAEWRTVEPPDREALARIVPDVPHIPEVSLLPRRAGRPSTAAWAARALRYRRLLRVLWRERRDAVIVNLNGDLVPSPAHLTFVHFPLAAAGRWPAAGPFRSALAARVVGGLVRLENRRALRKGAPRLLANSTFTRRALQESLGADAEVVHPPVRLLTPGLGAASREDAVLTVASFRARKRLDRVLDVAELVPQGRFRIVGAAGPEGARIADRLGRAVFDRGLQSRVSLAMDAPWAELERLYRTSKVYLHPTPEEHFGMTTVEAMSAGCVPVVPRSGGQWVDVLEARDGEAGFGYDEPVEAAAAARGLLADPARWTAMGQRALDRAGAFSETVFARKFVRIFEEVAVDVGR